MTHNKKPPLDPTAQRLATETLAHTGEARRLIADLAKSRGAPIPTTKEPTLTGFEDIEEEITGMHEALDKIAAREAMQSEASVRVGPVHVRLSSLPAWAILLLLIALAGIAGFVWIATHPPAPASLPVAVPAHS